MATRENLAQHVVPKFYIAGFAGAGGRVHARDLKRNHAFTASPSNLATEDECFTIYTDRKRDLSCDDTNSEVENRFARHIQSLDPNVKPLTEQWQAIWVFAANLICRSRRARDRTNDELGKSVEAIDKILPFLKTLEVPDLVQEMLGDEPLLADDTLKVLKRATEVNHPLMAGIGLEAVANELKPKPVCLLVSPPNCRFITSDDPVLVFKIDKLLKPEFKIGFIADPKVSVFLPLKPNVACLWGTGKSFLVKQISELECKRYNQMVADSCYTQVYAKTNDDLGFLV